MNRILKLPFPVAQSKKEIGLYSFAVAVATYFFIACYQPFGTYNYEHDYKYFLLIPYAAISFVIFFGGDCAVARVFKQWRWKHEIIKIAVFLLLCSFLNYLYSIIFINHAPFSLRTLYYMMLFTYALGIPICALSFPLRYKISIPAPSVLLPVAHPVPLAPATTAVDRLDIVPDSGDRLMISSGTFLFAQSEGNYSLIYFLEDDKLNKALLRLSLKKLEAQICNGTLLRCHRSYIINTKWVLRKKGNAQGYKIWLPHMEEPIPVSRKYIDSILQAVLK